MIYYIGQALDVTLDVTMDNELSVTDATEKKIQYKTPKGTILSVDAESVQGSESTLKASFDGGVLTEIGKYYFWVYLMFPGNKPYYGTPSTIELYSPGTPVK
jgi:hypothetical protein